MYKPSRSNLSENSDLPPARPTRQPAVTFAKRTPSGRYVNYSRDNLSRDDLDSEISSVEFMNYTVQIPPTPDNQPMDPSISQRVEEQYVSNSLFTGGFNNTTRAHLMDKVNESGASHPQMAGAKGSSCAVHGCDGKVMSDGRGMDILPCECDFKICRDCYIDAVKGGDALCPGCKTPYKQTDLDEKAVDSNGRPLSYPNSSGMSKTERRLSLMKSTKSGFGQNGGEFDHNRWLFETKGTYGYDILLSRLILYANVDFQKEIVKAAETFTAIGFKKIDADTKLSEDCCKYGSENIEDEILSKAASIYGDARKHMVKEQEDLNKLIMSQVLDPFRAMVTGAPLEDARHLAQRYSRMRQDAEVQVTEVSRRNQRVREAPTQENVGKLHAAEARLQELKANMAVLGKEAAAALAAAESQQEKLTFQRLVALVEGEKNYHIRLATILAEVEAEMVSEKQQKEASPPCISVDITPGKTTYFLAEATHSFYAETEKELSLSVGDYVVVRKVSPSGWSEGECNGKSGWFPSGYVEKRQRIPSTNGTAEEY